jgi:hypothetical protein
MSRPNQRETRISHSGFAPHQPRFISSQSFLQNTQSNSLGTSVGTPESSFSALPAASPATCCCQLLTLAGHGWMSADRRLYPSHVWESHPEQRTTSVCPRRWHQRAR